MKICDLEDFGNDEAGKTIYDSWGDGYLILCADRQYSEFIKARGETASMIRSNWRFVIETCTDPEKGCAVGSEAENVVNSLEVTTYNIQKYVDFLDRNYPPTHKIQSSLFKEILQFKRDKITSKRMLLAKNEMNFEDSLIPFQEPTFEGTYYSL